MGFENGKEKLFLVMMQRRAFRWSRWWRRWDWERWKRRG